MHGGLTSLDEHNVRTSEASVILYNNRSRMEGRKCAIISISAFVTIANVSLERKKGPEPKKMARLSRKAFKIGWPGTRQFCLKTWIGHYSRSYFGRGQISFLKRSHRKVVVHPTLLSKISGNP